MKALPFDTFMCSCRVWAGLGRQSIGQRHHAGVYRLHLFNQEVRARLSRGRACLAAAEHEPARCRVVLAQEAMLHARTTPSSYMGRAIVQNVRSCRARCGRQSGLRCSAACRRRHHRRAKQADVSRAFFWLWL